MAIVLRITHKGSHKFLDITKSLKPITFGRSDECDYTIKDDGCSGTHLEISIKIGQISIKDLKSKNGTILNNKKVTKEKLYVDDILQIGDVLIELHTDSLTTIERNTYKNQRAREDNQGAGDLTIPNVSKSQKNKESLVGNKEKRHGFDELTNITGIGVKNISTERKKKK